MKVENIKKDIIFNSYKHMCEVLGLKVTSGNSKVSQFKELDRYCRYHKEGNKIIIDEVYDEIKSKDDNRIEGNNHTRKRFNRLKMNREEQDSKGVYAIYDKNNNIYIGSTITSFRQRFHQHKSKSNPLPTLEMLTIQRNGGVMIPLFIMNDIEDEELIRMVENEFIKYYILQPDWNVVNTNESYRYKNKDKYKNIKVKENDYIQAMQLLAKQGLVNIDEVEI